MEPIETIFIKNVEINSHFLWTAITVCNDSIMLSMYAKLIENVKFLIWIWILKFSIKITFFAKVLDHGERFVNFQSPQMDADHGNDRA